MSLAPIGLSEGAAEGVKVLAERCTDLLEQNGPIQKESLHAFFVPGRIEVLGKHTDYAGGRSLLAALERGICIVANSRSDNRVVMTDAIDGERVEFTLAADLAPTGTGWVNYPWTVARRITRNFPGRLRGADIAFASNLPPASGMSSSSALIIATFLALSEVNRLRDSEVYRSSIRGDTDLAVYLAAIENGSAFRSLEGDHGVGTQGGSEDHTAILCARPDRLAQFSFDPVRFEHSVAVPTGHTFAIACSGVRAEKSGDARDRYNRAAQQMQIAAEIWRRETGRSDRTVGAALGPRIREYRQLRKILQQSDDPRASAAELVARFDQFVTESWEIIPQAASALARDNLPEFGILAARSQSLAEQVLENQVAETSHLAHRAYELGAVAASSFGAGFGGSVWALVQDSRAEQFLESWRADYLQRFPEREGNSAFFISKAGPAAHELV